MTGYVLGISSHFHDSAAALIDPSGQIVTAVQEERFTRTKADWRFPDNAIAHCLGALPEGAELRHVAYYEDPGLKVQRILQNARHQFPRGAPLWPRTIETLRALHSELPEQLLKVAGDPEKIVFVPHHRSHAASAFWPSPFEEAAVLVLDGVGEFSTTTMWRGGSDKLTALKEIQFPNSLGLFYSAFTQYLGFKVNSGEYKLMGLAPFGEPTQTESIRSNLIHFTVDGSFALNMDYFAFDRALSTTSPLFEQLFRHPQREPDEPVTAFHMNLAASAQAVLEDIVLALSRTALNLAGSRNLCLAGGVALNCVANGRIAREIEDLESLWVQPAAGDAGGSLGAALELSPRPQRTRGTDSMRAAYLGPAYHDQQVREALDRAELVYETYSEDEYPEIVASLLADQLIIGHFNGAMEFGPRALGNRSILADPRPAQMLTRVNRKIKFRESWRPFAPMVLADRASEFFEEPSQSPYMLSVSYLRDAYRKKRTLKGARGAGIHDPIELVKAIKSDYNAISHVNFSARLQTIEAESESRAGQILKAFERKTGCPILLNTSFNVRGEPIVCSPRDAIDCFLNTHLDVLAIGSFVVRKTAQSQTLQDLVGRKKFAAD